MNEVTFHHSLACVCIGIHHDLGSRVPDGRVAGPPRSEAAAGRSDARAARQGETVTVPSPLNSNPGNSDEPGAGELRYDDGRLRQEREQETRHQRVNSGPGASARGFDGPCVDGCRDQGRPAWSLVLGSVTALSHLRAICRAYRIARADEPPSRQTG